MGEACCPPAAGTNRRNQRPKGFAGGRRRHRRTWRGPLECAVQDESWITGLPQVVVLVCPTPNPSGAAVPLLRNEGGQTPKNIRTRIEQGRVGPCSLMVTGFRVGMRCPTEKTRNKALHRTKAQDRPSNQRPTHLRSSRSLKPLSTAKLHSSSTYLRLCGTENILLPLLSCIACPWLPRSHDSLTAVVQEWSDIRLCSSL